MKTRFRVVGRSVVSIVDPGNVDATSVAVAFDEPPVALEICSHLVVPSVVTVVSLIVDGISGTFSKTFCSGSFKLAAILRGACASSLDKVDITSEFVVVWIVVDGGVVVDAKVVGIVVGNRL